MQISVALILGICPVKHILPFSPRGNSQQQFWIVFYFSKIDVETFVLFWEILRPIMCNVMIFNLRNAASSEPMMGQINIYPLIKKRKIPYHSGTSAFLAINNILCAHCPLLVSCGNFLGLKYLKQISWEHYAFLRQIFFAFPVQYIAHEHGFPGSTNDLSHQCTRNRLRGSTRVRPGELCSLCCCGICLRHILREIQAMLEFLKMLLITPCLKYLQQKEALMR